MAPPRPAISVVWSTKLLLSAPLPMGSTGVPLSDPALPPELMNRGVSGGASHPPDLIRLLLPSSSVDAATSSFTAPIDPKRAVNVSHPPDSGPVLLSCDGHCTDFTFEFEGWIARGWGPV